MKVLIWFLCIFACAIITSLIKETGIILGAIPTVILFTGTMWLARTLCKKWDEHNKNKATKESAPVPKPQPTAENNDHVRFCRKCGEKLIDNSQFCRKCGTEVVKEQHI